MAYLGENLFQKYKFWLTAYESTNSLCTVSIYLQQIVTFNSETSLQ